MPGFVLADIPDIMYQLFTLDEESVRPLIGNVAIGLIFAALVVSSLLVETFKQASAKTIRITDID